jgi:hypothetical protein
MKMKRSIITIIFGLSLIASCGKDSGGDKGVDTGPAVQEQEAAGNYMAIMRPYNNSLSGYLPTGKAEIRISGDSVSVKTYLDDDAKVTHIQNIHVGTRCPNASDDVNGDGLVDVNESYAIVGDVLVPLDANINTASDGQSIYPLGGNFTYFEQASLSKLETDAKARTNQNLNLGGRVILMHGVDMGASMPISVTTKNAMPIQTSVPIACGIIKRL